MPESNRHSQITEPPRPATHRPARIRTRTSEVGARRAPGYTTGLHSRFPDVSLSARRPVEQCLDTRAAGWRALSGARRARSPAPPGGRARRSGKREKRTTWFEQASTGWRPGALPTELRPRDAPGWSRTSALCRIRAVLSTELRAFSKPPAGVEPAPRPFKGRVLPLTLRRPGWRRRESNSLLLVASEALCLQSFIPERF